MKVRCYYPDNPRYADYGGRGIKVCEQWQESFPAFLADMGPRPSAQHSLEREDNDGDYTPDNCVWALPQQQAVNRRNNLFIGDVPLATLAKQHNIPKNTLRFRILKGWSVEDALTKPVRAKRSR
jgi:hypothetical protein